MALIVDEHGQLAAFPYHLKLRDRPQDAPSDDLRELDELVDTWIVDAYRKLEKERAAADAAGKEHGEGRDYTVSTTDGVRYIARAHWFPSRWASGWRLVVVVPEVSLLNSADRLLSESAAISIIMLMCHRLPPEEITRVLTTQLDLFTRILLHHRGTLDNYLGEALLAFWGAPVDVSDGPERACRAALACLRAERALLNGEADVVRGAARNLFAIHRGRALVGNIGSNARLSYMTQVEDNERIDATIERFARVIQRLEHRQARLERRMSSLYQSAAVAFGITVVSLSFLVIVFWQYVPVHGESRAPRSRPR